MSIIQVFFIAGRTDEQKERLIAALTDAAVHTVGMAREEVRVILKDIPNTEYGISGKTAKSLGRGVDRHGRTPDAGCAVTAP
ncbi:2-hydroxymuconate tautomerase family protein [Herbaspirillum robiniae]|uniref:Tautomerase n=1 Tax=Herbaspirillum robiniae TaxID=2014887 RepID=A0ABX2LZE6_9BURK|nr:2-hydroxymuconate tautomerase family protein [Herbaspirillum robiniae]NUU03842.1 2-hydroxymuconate tautomerase family protein [Herbaspirillum robiniae]